MHRAARTGAVCVDAGAGRDPPYDAPRGFPSPPIDRRRPPLRLPGYELRGLTPCRDRAVQAKIRLTGPEGLELLAPDPTTRRESITRLDHASIHTP